MQKGRDPDYEEITPGPPPAPHHHPPAAQKEAGAKVSTTGIVCDLCGTSEAMVRCPLCSGQRFCLACDDLYHRHPKRSSHLRKVSEILLTEFAYIPLPTSSTYNCLRKPNNL